MSEAIFIHQQGGERSASPVYRDVSRREYFDGEYQIVPAPYSSVRIEKGLDAGFSIIRITSTTPLKFKRGWPHIRKDGLDVSVLWFVEKGSIVFTHADRTDVIPARHCAISRTRQPFRMECLTDDASQHEVLQVVVPTHLMVDLIPDDVRPGASFATSTGDCRLALRTFQLLYEEGTAISSEAADGLAREALRAIGALVRQCDEERQLSVADRRYEAIVAFIENHLTNQNLTAAMVARGVGISPSYLMHVLKVRDTSCSDLLWGRRIERARKLLGAESAAELSVKQVAHRSGFKSHSHFSRAFRQATGQTPRAYRKAPPA